MSEKWKFKLLQVRWRIALWLIGNSSFVANITITPRGFTPKGPTFVANLTTEGFLDQ